jgi:hypothetical protein
MQPVAVCSALTPRSSTRQDHIDYLSLQVQKRDDSSGDLLAAAVPVSCSRTRPRCAPIHTQALLFRRTTMGLVGQVATFFAHTRRLSD